MKKEDNTKLKSKIILKQNNGKTESNFIYTMDFIQYAYNLKTNKKYPYKRLKSELQQLNQFSKLADESLDKFIDACKVGFARLKAIKQATKDILTNYTEKKSMIINRKDSVSLLRQVILCGDYKHTGPWADSETRQLLYVLEKGKETNDIFNAKGGINWIFVSSHVKGRTPKACEDKYRSLLKNGEIDEVVFNPNVISDVVFNKQLHKAFKMQQEMVILEQILQRIDDGVLVTKKDISMLALDKFYTPINIPIKAVIFKYPDKKQWPFDKNGNISIENFDEEVDELIPFANDDMDAVMAKYGIKYFKGSLTWVGKFMAQHHLVFRECHLKRRGTIKDDDVDELLSKVSDGLITYL